MVYFSSDHHFFHTNIIQYCNRPFTSVDEMNKVMIQRWNSVVQPDDIVYYLGDMFMGQKNEWPSIRAQLAGKIFFIVGNHDRKKVLEEMNFEAVVQELVLECTMQGRNLRVLLRHQPDYERSNEFDFHFCGHVHEKWKRQGNIINVGVDVWDFTPRIFKTLIEMKDG